MPMESFFLILMGGILLIIVYLIEKISLKKFLLIFILFIASFILPQIFAILTGVSSGEKELTPTIFSIFIIFIAIYSLLEVILGIFGIKLIKKI